MEFKTSWYDITGSVCGYSWNWRYFTLKLTGHGRHFCWNQIISCLPSPVQSSVQCPGLGQACYDMASRFAVPPPSPARPARPLSLITLPLSSGCAGCSLQPAGQALCGFSGLDVSAGYTPKCMTDLRWNRNAAAAASLQQVQPGVLPGVQPGAAHNDNIRSHTHTLLTILS